LTLIILVKKILASIILNKFTIKINFMVLLIKTNLMLWIDINSYWFSTKSKFFNYNGLIQFGARE